MSEREKKRRPETPYEGLLKEAREYAREVRAAARPRAAMYAIPKRDVEARTAYRLDDVAQRVQAADQLGFDVTLAWEDRGLVFYYRKRTPDAPWRLR